MDLTLTLNSAHPAMNVIGKMSINDDELQTLLEESVNGTEYMLNFAYRANTNENCAIPQIKDIIEVQLVSR
jgi:hypothetical protein